MIIVDENNKIVDHERVEQKEQSLVKQYINKDDVVLELGARYGSVSCTINQILENKENQVVVEPDPRVWDALEKNRGFNKCSFRIIKGFISKQSYGLTNTEVCNGYGTTYSCQDDNNKIPNYSMEDVLKLFPLKFNVLVADCEGFLEIFLDENPFFYDDCRLVIFEEDYKEKCDYAKIKTILLQKGFECLYEDGQQNVYRKK